MRQNFYSPISIAALCLLMQFSGSGIAKGQTTYSADPKLSVPAELVLTPEFCATKTKKGTWGINQESFDVGKVACAELEPAIKTAFRNLTRVEEPSSKEEVRLVLTPRFADIGATQKMGAFSNRELVVMVEWTAKDREGKTVWVETVQGSAKHHMGNAFTHGKNLKLIVSDSVKDMAQRSASQMSASPELRKLVN